MLIAGTDVGLIKIFPPKDTSSKRKREEDEQDELVKAIGKVDREREIQAVQSCRYSVNGDEIDAVVLARKDGSVDLCCKDGKTLQTWMVEASFQPIKKTAGVKGAAWASSNRFVGVDYRQDTLITCTGTGMVRYTRSDMTRTFQVLKTPPADSGINSMKVHPTDMHIFATGGEELDLSIWHVGKDGTDGVLEPVWKAKNVPNDNLDLRVPVWITSLTWIGPDRVPIHEQKQRGPLEEQLKGLACQIAVGTGYGQVRFYDVCGEQKRPLLNQVVTVDRKPVRSIATARHQDKYVCVVGDTIGTVLVVDMTNGTTLSSLHPTAGGSVSSLLTLPTTVEIDRFIATGSIDRFVRVYDLQESKPKMVAKVYLKQRVTGLASIGPIEFDMDGQDTDAAEDDVWESIPLVKKKKRLE